MSNNQLEIRSVPLLIQIEKREVSNGAEDEVAGLGTTFVTSIADTMSNLADSLQDAGTAAESDMEEVEWITLPESASYLGPLLKILAIAHSLLSMSMLVAYYFLKVIAGHD